MAQTKKTKSAKHILLPLTAGIMVALSLIVVVFIPRSTDKTGGTKTSVNAVAEPDGEGRLVIYADRLSSDQVSFIRVSEDSRIELLARLGEDGTVKAALGTCQSCNGSPGAYYTQEGDVLRCNNCDLIFPISVLDSPGGGCHPIMLDEELVQAQGSNLKIDLNGLSEYEDLFSKVEDH